MTAPVARIGIIGGGLMGQETASAFGRWFVLKNFPVRAELVGVCDTNPAAREWFRQIPTVKLFTGDHRELLRSNEIDLVYVAVPHHLHEQIYIETLRAGKDLLAEKPFGIDLAAARKIAGVAKETGRFARCSSEFPFLPGGQRAFQIASRPDIGPIIEVRCGFHHSSDLDPQKPINWKRQTQFCGVIGVMGDLGMHVLHLPLRLGWKPKRVFAQLQKIYETRPDGRGGFAPADTFDNALLNCDVEIQGRDVPMRLEMKRLAPGETNTWFFEVLAANGGVRYSTKEPKTFWTFSRASEQTWQRTDLGFQSVFPTITGGIFEPGFPDCFLQMWAAFLAERAGHLEKRFGTVTPEEAVSSHELFDAALRSHESHQVVEVGK